VSPTQSEMSARESLLKRISNVVTKLWSGAKVVGYIYYFNFLGKLHIMFMLVDMIKEQMLYIPCFIPMLIVSMSILLIYVSFM